MTHRIHNFAFDASILLTNHGQTVACLEALCEADCMQSRIQKYQQYSLMPYIPFAARRIHAACSTSAQPTIEFPRSMTQV
jgi:hypothetical protein